MVNPKDVRPMGEPETIIYVPDHTQLVGLYIPESGQGSVMLGIRQDAQGIPVSCAIGDMHALNMPVQSNPRREKRHGYGYSEGDDDRT